MVACSKTNGDFDFRIRRQPREFGSGGETSRCTGGGGPSKSSAIHRYRHFGCVAGTSPNVARPAVTSPILNPVSQARTVLCKGNHWEPNQVAAAVGHCPIAGDRRRGTIRATSDENFSNRFVGVDAGLGLPCPESTLPCRPTCNRAWRGWGLNPWSPSADSRSRCWI